MYEDFINEYYAYFEGQPIPWHDYAIGNYHLSAIGVSHQELDPKQHSGPCLKKLYDEYQQKFGGCYVEPPERKGIFKIGIMIHKEIQENAKEKDPSLDVEYALILPLAIGKDVVYVKGSIDLLSRYDPYLTDIKSSAPYNMPKNEKDYHISHGDQTILYTYIYNNKMRNLVEMPEIEDVRIAYVSKHNLDTRICNVDYDDDIGKEYYDDLMGRVKYFHKCLKKQVAPIGEPMKYCKYCELKGECEEFKNGS